MLVDKTSTNDKPTATSNGDSLVSGFPRVNLGHFPTPLEPMVRLTQHLQGPQLFIKREDCSGLAMGGNKVRQMEFHLGDAIARGADTVISTSAVQSNHLRVLAAAACKLGLACEIQREDRVAEYSEQREKTAGDNILYIRPKMRFPENGVYQCVSAPVYHLPSPWAAHLVNLHFQRSPSSSAGRAASFVKGGQERMKIRLEAINQIFI